MAWLGRRNPEIYGTTNLAKRDIKSVLASAADGMLMGLGVESYLLALDAMLDLLQKRNG